MKSPWPVLSQRRSPAVLPVRCILLAVAAVIAGAAPASGQEPAAVFEVGEEAYGFDRVLCSLPEDAGRELAVRARQNGLTLDISRDEAIGPVVSLYDNEDPGSPSVSWEAPDPAMMPGQRRSLELIQVDGTRITVEATFTNEHTGATADGRVVVDCS